MSIQKQKEKKKKEREKIAKAKVAHRREQLRSQRRLEKQEMLMEKEAHEIVHGKSMPIIKDPNVLAQMEALKAEEVAAQLKKNLAILEALEAEYEAEQAARMEMNDKLESEGHKTMKEKMDALHEKALALTNKAQLLADAKKDYAEQQNNLDELEKSEKND